MPQFPPWSVLTNASAATFASMLDNNVVKASSTPIASNIVPATDPELQGIALGVGTWEIDCLFFALGTGSGASNITTKWGFSGAVSSSPTPTRTTFGPASTVTSSPTVATIVNLGATTWSNNNTYGLGGAVTVTIRETCPSFIVTTAGNFSILWSQGVSNASPTTLLSSSRVKVRQIG